MTRRSFLSRASLAACVMLAFGAMLVCSPSVRELVAAPIVAPADHVKLGTVDPSAGAGVQAAIGAIYSRRTAGNQEVWKKTGTAATAWTRIDGGGASTITGAGTANRIAKFTGGQAIGNSSCIDTGADLTCDPSSTIVLSANGVERLEMASGSTRYVGIGHMGSTSPISQLEVYDSNAGQTTAALTDAGSRAGMIYVADGGTAVDTGGAIVFGNGTTHGNNDLGFVAIKGLIQSGANNGQGDIAISTRVVTTDSALTEQFRITAAGSIRLGTTNTNLTTVWGHKIARGTAPSIGTCGGSPTIVGTDYAMRIVSGSAAGGACTITFSRTWTNAPVCVVTAQTGTGTNPTPSYSASATAITFTAISNSATYNIHCICAESTCT